MAYVGGGFEIGGYEDFARLTARFDSDPKALSDAGRQALAYVEHKAGAIRKILSDVFA